MRRALVAGNWKMNGSRAMARELAREIVAGVAAGARSAVDVAICPPFPYLGDVAAALGDGGGVALGAQDVAAEPPGAFTGDVAAEMLVDLGCTMVLVGHSERRQLRGESDAVVAAKFRRALEAGLTPVLCLGETLAEREDGRTADVVARQLAAVVEANGAAAVAAAVIAYEPVWAIGTGRTASPEQAQEVHGLLRARLADAGADAAGTRILYGGSVKPGNAGELFAMDDIDGGLIGGASLEAGDFLAICAAAGN